MRWFHMLLLTLLSLTVLWPAARDAAAHRVNAGGFAQHTLTHFAPSKSRHLNAIARHLRHWRIGSRLWRVMTMRWRQ
jgi:hypothetical protein